MASLRLDGKMLFAMFFAAVIATVLLATVADSTFGQTSTFTALNETVTAPAVNGTLDVNGRALVAGVTPQVFNATDKDSADLQGSGVFLVTETGSNGLRTVQLQVNDTGAAYAGQNVNLTYTYEPDGYLANSGARSVTNLIVIFGALAVLVTVIVFLFRGSLNNLLKVR